MGDHAEHDFVSLAEEARRCQAHHQILAHQNTRDHAACLAVIGHGADGGTPGGEGVGKVELDARVAVGAGATVGFQ